MKDFHCKVAEITGAGGGVGSALVVQLAKKIGMTAEHVAGQIIRAVRKNKIRIRIGKDSVMLGLFK